MQQMNKLGTVQTDGSILLYDENIKFRKAMSGHYRRISQTAKQKTWLATQGYRSTNSSFISAISRVDDNLFIRFHNASVYVYYGFGEHFDKIFKALSKGQYFNRFIRPTKNYEKIESLPFPPDLGEQALTLGDEEMFAALDMDYIKKLSGNLKGAEIYAEQVVKKGVYYTEYIIKFNKETIKILMPIMALNIMHR